MPDFRRGAAGVAEAQKKATSGGSFSPFAPEMFWKSDADERYLLFLNPMDEIPTVDMISFIPQKRKKANGEAFTVYERVVARTDSSIGEATDAMADDWQGKPRDTCVAIAVELEPTLEKQANGRMRPTGFHVKTDSYERRVRDDKGELTDETEEVTTPVLGIIHASPHNFFNVVSSADANDFPIEDTAVKITRVGTKTDTTYTVTGYPDQEIDLGDLIEYIEGVSYLTDEEMDTLVEAVDAADNDKEAGLAIGEFVLNKRMEELCDGERYDKLYESITETLDKFSGKGKKDGKKERTSRRERPARPSSRRGRQVEEEVEAAEADAAPETDAETPAEEKPKRQRRSRAAKPAEEPAAEETPAEEALKARRARKPKEKPAEEAPVTSQQDPDKVSKLDRLRKRSEEHDAAKA